MELTLAIYIGREIRAEMARQRMTHLQLANHLGLSQNVVSQRLAGRIEFRPSELAIVSEVLGVPLLNFFPVPATAA